MSEFKTSSWEQLAADNGLDSFEAVWELDVGWFEAPNRRRGGWSGVSQAGFACANDRREEVFIKRQQDHTKRTLMHPFAGVLTFQREFENLERLHACDVPNLEVLYFAQRRQDGKRQAILVTRALTGYESLEILFGTWQQGGWPERAAWQRLLRRLAGIARRMHEHRIEHNCFFPKHVFIRDIETDPDIRLIDLEKAKRTFCSGQAMMRDLDSFNRRTPAVSNTNRLRFLLAYLGKPRVDRYTRKVWKKLAQRMLSKGR